MKIFPLMFILHFKTCIGLNRHTHCEDAVETSPLNHERFSHDGKFGEVYHSDRTFVSTTRPRSQ